MRSNVTFQLDSGATIMGAGGTGYDDPEPNQFDDFQDFGHSHFHNAMIFGDRLDNIGFVGGGVILPATPETLVALVAAAKDAPEELTLISFVMYTPPMPFVPSAALLESRGTSP